jgi:hypothetical protein
VPAAGVSRAFGVRTHRANLVLRIAPVVGPCQHDFARAVNAQKIADVPIGLVEMHALAEPDDGPRQIGGAAALDLRARRQVGDWDSAGIPRDGVSALPVHVDCAPRARKARDAVPPLDLQHFCATASSRSTEIKLPPSSRPGVEHPRRECRPVDEVGPTSRIHASLLEISTTRTAGGSNRRAFANWRAETPTVTGSLPAIAAATAAKASCAGLPPSRQLSGRSGHSIQQPACGSNSPGMR